MTAIACTALAAPTPFERVLLAVSARLSGIARERMLRRAASADRAVLRRDVDEAQRDLAGSVRAGILPR